MIKLEHPASYYLLSELLLSNAIRYVDHASLNPSDKANLLNQQFTSSQPVFFSQQFSKSSAFAIIQIKDKNSTIPQTKNEYQIVARET